MQGKLSEIDIRSILQLIQLGQRTGDLFIEAHNTLGGTSEPALTGPTLRSRPAKPASTKSWFVFFSTDKLFMLGIVEAIPHDSATIYGGIG